MTTDTMDRTRPPHGRISRLSWLAVLIIGVASYLLVLHTLVATRTSTSSRH